MTEGHEHCLHRAKTDALVCAERRELRERVAAHEQALRAAVAAEREACAKVVEEVGARWLGRGAAAFEEVAAAIRARQTET